MRRNLFEVVGGHSRFYECVCGHPHFFEAEEVDIPFSFKVEAVNILYYIMVLLDCIILHYIILRPCLYTFNVGGLPHLFRKWIAQVVDTSTLEMG